MKVKWHPVLVAPTAEAVRIEAEREGINYQAALEKLVNMRQRIIDVEESDPLRYGWEPPIWKVCDALLGFDWHDEKLEERLQRRFGFGWQEWSRRLRLRCGYDAPARMLLILGGNRSSKSEYAAKRGMLTLAHKPESRIYPMHMSNPRSVRDQQPLFWKYMPPEWRMQRAGVFEYIKYKRKTGFADNSFITPILSECMFLNYMQDRDTALEGLEADLVLPDEMIPADWVETMIFRLATRAGRGIITFTPVNGYSPTVKLFCDGAKVVKWGPACLCPLDGGPRDEAATLGLTQNEYDDLWAMTLLKKGGAFAPASRPEDCFYWGIEERQNEEPTPAFGHPSGGGDQRAAGPEDHALPKGQRKFERLPRVMRCADARKAVVFFWGNDNPYGNPKEVIAELRKKPTVYVRERFYGKAEKTYSAKFPRFNRAIHLVKARDIPQEDCLRYMFMDPAADRNFFMSWFTATRRASYLTREWPGRYEIPGIGVPEYWAIPSGRNDGINDGARGEGQGPWGFGILRYKFEIARLEGWNDYRKWKLEIRNAKTEYPDEEELIDWDEAHGAVEVIEARFIDSRAASTPRVEDDRPITLLTALEDIGLFFSLTPGAEIQDGVSKINSALDYEEGTEAQSDKGTKSEGKREGLLIPPKFYICEECENTVYALEHWMGVDGQKGACKDPIDNTRYFFTADCEYYDEGAYKPRGGYGYGREIRMRRPFGGKRRLPV